MGRTIRLLVALVLIAGTLTPATRTLAMSPVHPDAQPARVRGEEQPRLEAVSALSELRARTGSDWQAHFDAATGLVSSVWGGQSASKQETPEAAALDFVRTSGRLFGLTSGRAQLKLIESVPSLTGWHVRFAQMQNGIPVYGATLSVHVDTAMAVRQASSSVRDRVTDTDQARLTPDQAQRTALDLLGTKGELRGPVHSGLFVLAEGARSTLVYAIEVPARDPLGDWEVLVDARSGQVVRRTNTLKFVEGKGKVFDPNPCVTLHDATLRDNNASPTAVPDAAYKEVTLHELDGSGKLVGPYVDLSGTTGGAASEASETFEYNRTDQRFEQVMVYYHLDRIERYYQSLGFNNVQHRRQVANAHGTTEDNSWYSPQTKELTFGDGGVPDAQDADVVCHEYGHATQDNECPGFGGTSEGGAMGEGFGDYLAGSVRSDESFFPEALAIWDATAYSSANPPNLRRLDSEKHYPQDIQNEVHADGEMWSGSLWKVRAKMGAHDCDKLVLQSHFYLTPQATFADGIAALLQADKELYAGSHTADIKAVFVARGMLTITGTLHVAITGPDGKPLGGQVQVSGQPSALTAAADTGVVDTALPPADYKVTVSAFGYVTQKDLAVTIAADQTATLAVKLDKAPPVAIHGKVSRADTGEALAAQIALKGTPLAPVQTAADGTFRFEAPAGTYTLVATAPGFRPYIKNDLAISADSEMEIKMDRLPEFLVVAHDSGKGYAHYYQEALDAAHQQYDVWNSATQGALSDESLLGYHCVIWFSGDLSQGTVTAPEQQLLARYVSSGGRLLITGQDIGADLKDTSFYKDVLGAKFVADAASTREVLGTNLDLKIEGGDGAGNQHYPDVIAAADGAAGVETYLRYKDQTDGVAALRRTSGNGRVVYLGFGFEGIDTAASRTALMADIVGWLKPDAVSIASRVADLALLAEHGAGSPQGAGLAAIADAYGRLTSEWAATLGGTDRARVSRVAAQGGGLYRPMRAALATAGGR